MLNRELLTANIHAYMGFVKKKDDKIAFFCRKRFPIMANGT